MPYALFSNDARLSKTYPTEADVWKLARRSGLVVDVVSDDEKPAPRPVLVQQVSLHVQAPIQVHERRGVRSRADSRQAAQSRRTARGAQRLPAEQARW